MSDEARIEEEKQAIASMRAAQSNMIKALRRIETLEGRLKSAATHLDAAANYVPNGYRYNSTKKLSDMFKEYAEEARKDL